jgi:hypothetical protein
MTTYTGSCHCGVVKFRIDAVLAEATTCDCSLCLKRNAVMVKVPEQAMTVVEGEELLTLYQWNLRIARHYFCSRCGIYVFHRKRSQPDHFGINVFCLDEFDVRSLPVRATEGANMTVADANARSGWPGPRV